MKRTILYATVLLAFSISSCNNQNKSNSEPKKVESNLKKEPIVMKSHISIFEIPATDISRAVDFYQTILNVTIEVMDMEGMQMGIFPYEEQMVTGVIIKGAGYQPSADGVTIYLNAGENLQVVLDKVAEKGGKIILPKTLHGDESGFFALFLDSEGNRIGLHSPK